MSDETPHYDSRVVAATLPGTDAVHLARALKQRQILVSARHSNLRVSTNFYNNSEKLDRLSEELRRLL